MDLHNPLNTNTTLATEEEACPVLLMIEKLRELNFIALTGRIEHTNLEKVYDCRKVLSNKKYVRCVLQLNGLLATNPISCSAQPNTYYELASRNIHVINAPKRSSKILYK